MNTEYQALRGAVITSKGDQYIVMGDNRPISSDSREFGPLHESELIALIKHSPTPPRIARPILTNYLAILKQPSYLAIKLDHE